VPGYLAAFKAAKRNGDLARTATGTFNPAYNANVAGSVPLPFFSQLASGGLLSNATIRNLIDTNAAGELANTYQVNGLQGSVNFFRNPYALGTNVLTNISSATYNGLQIDYRKNMGHGVQVQGNYTLAKSLSDSAGDSQTRFEPFLDNANGRLEYGPSAFDQRHVVHVNGIWDLPIGKGRMVDIQNPILNAVIGGWSTSGIMTWTSGTPFSILSARGTLNRSARSGANTASTLVDGNALRSAMGVMDTGNGPYFVNLANIGSDGRGVNADNTYTYYSGQLFVQPGAGQLGNLQRRMFYGPNYWNLDFSALKKFMITEKQSLEVKMESFNFTNHPSFNVGDQTITSTTFGKITGTQSGRRVIQFGAYYKF